MEQELVVTSNELSGGVVLLEMNGYLDANTFDVLAAVVTQFITDAGRNRFVISLAGLKGISSAGASTLLSLSDDARVAGGALVVCELPKEVLRVLNILGLLATEPEEVQRIYMVEQREDAINWFSRI